MWEPEENEKVVHEVPVFLSKALLDKLYLIQHPLRPATSTFVEANVLEARIKPQQDKIQLTLEIDTDSTRYDKKVGEKIASQMTGTAWGDRNDEENPPEIDEQVLESIAIPEPAKSPRYVIGVIRGGQVHLTPLKSIVQMKPHFPHLNKDDVLKKSLNPESAGDTEDETEEEATKITVKFTQARSQGGKDRLSKSYNTLKKKEDEEPWIDLTYCQENRLEFDKLCSGNAESETPFYVLKRENYLDMLLPKHAEIDVDSPVDKKKGGNLITKRLNLSQLKLLNLGEQLRAILLNGGVLHYAHVVDFLKSKLQATFDDISLLKAIQTVAILVQGCWVVRSDLVFSAEFVSASHGIPGIVMQRARDTILHQFTEKRWLKRKRMCDLTHLPNEEVTEILSKIAHWMPGFGWEFSQPFDSDFVGKHPDVVQRQTLILEMKISKKNQINIEKNLKPPITSPPRRRSRNKSFSSDTDSESDSKSNNFRKQRTNSNTNIKSEQLLWPKIEPGS